MERFEATIEGDVYPTESFGDFNEEQVLVSLLTKEGLQPSLELSGRGGYYLYHISLNNEPKRLHVYLKKITFGGREARPHEKRVQFSAALDRRGYEAKDSGNDYSVIFGIYKASENAQPIICAWDIHDWGKNIGRAFNCFTDVRTIAKAYRDGFGQHKTSIGQITCSLKSALLLLYLSNKSIFHTRVLDQEDINELASTTLESSNKDDAIPGFEDLFQLIIDVLREHEGIMNIVTMETEIADKLSLSVEDRQRIHNRDEGHRTVLGYRLAWARCWLKLAGLIMSPRRKIWKITELGTTMAIDKAEIRRLKKDEEAARLFKKESAIDIEEADGVEIEPETDSQTIEHPFDPNLVDIRTRSMSLDLILKRLNNQAINMNTSFQRQAGLWTVTKQSRLIESILVKIPLPVFYFDGSDDNSWLVVDGLQRLSSLDNFVNKQAFSLTNLEFLSQFDGKRFTELPSHLQRRIEEFEITAYIIAPGTPNSLKFNVFKRINTGGLTLTLQEIRNALNQGVPAEFVKKLADSSSFKVATDYSIPEDRMLDREFVTRFLAFYLFTLGEYNSDLDAFLNNALERLSTIANEIGRLEKIESDFKRAMNTAYAIFGEHAFRKRYKVGESRKPINKALFETWSTLLSKLSTDQSTKLIQRKEQLQSGFINLLNNDEDFSKAISSSTTDKTRVKKRFDAIEQLIQRTLV